MLPNSHDNGKKGEMTNSDSRVPLVLPSKLPMPAGKSPFHIKGSAYAGLRTRQVKQVPGGLEQVLKFIEDPVTREFLRQRFLPTEWYDYLPVLILAGAAVAATGRQADDLITEGAVKHAEQDLGGVYRLLLFFTAPETAMRRMPIVYRQYFDFGNSDVRIVGKGVAESVISGVPAIAAPFFELYVGEFVHRLLVLSGGKNPRAQWATPEPDGEKAGIQTVQIQVRTTWSR
jgi:hypothetical protein